MIRLKSITKIAEAIYIKRSAVTTFLAVLLSGSPVYSGELPQVCQGDCSGVSVSHNGISSIVEGANRLDIHQSEATANINWKSFNISSGNAVQFHQPGSNAVAINKIFQNDPSKIYGSLTANGNVYLINANGFLFGNGSKVNVSSLIASTLDIQRDENGDPIPINLAIDDSLAAFENSDEVLMGIIKIDDGAELTTVQDGDVDSAKGKILVFAPEIVNKGKINTPEGQTILAASKDKVYLKTIDDDSAIKGFYVEVETGGDVTNLGEIIAEKGGGITLLGMAVNQSGIVRSTTTLTENGSINISAKDTVDKSYISDDGNWVSNKVTGNTGKVVFGKGGITEVIPDADEIGKSVDELEQLESWIDSVAAEIVIEDDATLRATSGNIRLTATETLNSEAATKTNNRIYISSGSVIDVSGSNKAVESVERNIVAVELRSNELKDSPLQRDGTLRGETVYVDIREGTDLADISGAVSGIERGLPERMSDGGTINIVSDGDVLVEQGATLDISGGGVNYKGGYISTTQLLKDGQLIDISDADPNVLYDGIAGSYTRTDSKWGVTESWYVNGADTKSSYEEGYFEGSDAGEISLTTSSLVMEGEIDSSTQAGIYQRFVGQDGYNSIPQGGSLSINVRKVTDSVQDVVFQGETGNSLQGYVVTPPPTESSADLYFSTEMINESGLASLSLETYGEISIAESETLNLESNGELSLLGARVYVDGAIEQTSGDATLVAEYSNANPSVYAEVVLGPKATINVSGNWVNDKPELLEDSDVGALVSVDAGSVSLIAEIGDKGGVRLDGGSEILALGGAWVDSDGVLNSGDGGEIKINSESKIKLGGDLCAAALENGGVLSISGKYITIGSEDEVKSLAEVGGEELVLTEKFFNTGGFSDYSINASHDLIIIDGANIDLVMTNLKLDSDYLLRESGTDLSSITTSTILPTWQRSAVDIALSLGDLGYKDDVGLQSLFIGNNTSIITEAGGNISLKSNQNLVINGTLLAPGGDINIKAIGPSGAVNVYKYQGYMGNRGVWLGGGANISVAATYENIPDDFGLKKASLFDAGTINIQSEYGYIYTEKGSVLDASGGSTVISLPQALDNGDIILSEQQVAMDAGSITLDATEGMLLNGSYKASAAVVDGSLGGSLFLINDPLGKVTLLNASRKVTDANYVNEFLASSAETYIHSDDFSAVFAQESTISDDFNGEIHINASSIKDAGFDSLKITTNNLVDYQSKTNPYREIGAILLSDSVELDLEKSLIFDTNQIITIGDASIDAAYVSLGRSGSNKKSQIEEVVDVFSGSGSLMVNADHIDLYESLTVNGAENISLNSSGDIRLNGINYGTKDAGGFDGELITTADIDLTARQIYVPTLTEYTIKIADNDSGIITIKRPDGVSADDTGDPIQAFGGELSIVAPSIYQGGVVKAPGGTINLRSGYYESEEGAEVLLSELQENVESVEAVVDSSIESDVVNTESELFEQDSSVGVIQFAEGSYTSVALDNDLVMFGSVANGLDWIYDFSGTGSTDSSLVVDSFYEKKIDVDALRIQYDESSVVDISSGGDLYGYEFVPGIGGSTDLLSNLNANGSFAIIPGYSGYGFADHAYYSGFEYGDVPGKQIYIGGGAKLEAGYYTVLPARYALLPGAYLITPEAGYSDILPGQQISRVDGESIIAGKFAIAGTDIIDDRWSGFVIENGSVARTRSEYFDYLGSPFIAAKTVESEAGVVASSLPIDAGHLLLSAKDSLTISGELRAEASDGGRGGWLDIVNPNIVFYSSVDQLPEETEIDYLYLEADGINSLDVDSILVGGRRYLSENDFGTVVNIEVGAENVMLLPEVELSGAEIILAASGDLDLFENSKISVSSVSESNLPISVSGDAALLRVSGGELVDLYRSDIKLENGNINIMHGALIESSNSIMISSSGSAALDGNLSFAPSEPTNEPSDLGTDFGGSLYLGATSITLTSDSSSLEGIADDSLIVSTTMLDKIDTKNLVLVGLDGVNINGGVDLSVSALRLETPGLTGTNNNNISGTINVENNLSISSAKYTLADGVAFSAGDLSESVSEGGNDLLGGALIVSGSQIILDSADLDFSGFKDISIKGSNGIAVSGDSVIRFNADVGFEVNDKNKVNIITPYIAISSGDSFGIMADNSSLAIANDESSELAIDDSVIGYSSKLQISAYEVDLESSLLMPAGIVSIEAENDLNISESSLIDVSGWTQTYYDKIYSASAGTVSFSSKAGDVNISGNIDISASADDSDSKAGLLSISVPQGALNLSGEIDAAALTDGNGGSIKVDMAGFSESGAVTSADQLLRYLSSAGADGDIALRLRDGSIVLGDEQQLEIAASEMELIADNGFIKINNTKIDTSAIGERENGGDISLWSKGDLLLSSDTSLISKGSEGDGGDILLSSATGMVTIESGAKIDIPGSSSNSSSAKGGALTIRANRNDNDVMVSHFNVAETVSGAENVSIEAFKGYEVAGTLAATDINSFLDDSAGYIADCIDGGGCAFWYEQGVELAPGIDIYSNGDLDVVSNINLIENRYAVDYFRGENESESEGNGKGIAGSLSIRAAGDLTFSNSLSDGVEVGKIVGAMGRLVNGDKVSTGDSWNYRIVSGADLGSSSLLEYQESGAGDLVLNSGSIIRTGTGDIDIVAGGDITLKDQTSVIYTVGEAQHRGAIDQLLDAEVKNINVYYSGQYLDNGGDISIESGGDINGAISGQLQTPWQHRFSTNGEKVYFAGCLPTTWGIYVSNFEQGIAALGGGDIEVYAGGNIEDLNLSIASSRRFDGEIAYLGPGRDEGYDYFGDTFSLFGGGDMTVMTSGSILGGVFSNDYGQTSIFSGSDITDGGNNLAPILMMMDSQITMASRRDLSIQTVMNSSWVYHSRSEPRFTALARSGGSTSEVFFYGYGDESYVSLVSEGGDIQVLNDVLGLQKSYSMFETGSEYYNKGIDTTSNVSSAWVVYPGMTDIVSLQSSISLGDVSYEGFLKIFPTRSSTLNILAEENIYTEEKFSIITIEAEPWMVPSLDGSISMYNSGANSSSFWVDKLFLLPSDFNGILQFLDTPLHIDDDEPNRIVSLSGDIIANNQSAPIEYFSSKPAYVIAGGDIQTVSLYIQNLQDDDISLVQAGDNISFYQTEKATGVAKESSPSGIKLAGPGTLNVIAGGDIDLASSKGIYTIGDQENSSLADTGADISILAGIGEAVNRTDFTDFIDRYLDDNAYIALQDQVVTLMRGYSKDDSLTYEEALQKLKALPEDIAVLLIDSSIAKDLPLGINSRNLLSYLDSLESYQAIMSQYVSENIDYLSDDISLENSSDLEKFKALSLQKQQLFVQQIFFNELKEAGKDGATKGADAYDRGYAAVYELYKDYALEGYDVESDLRHFLSEGTSFEGELSMYRSKIYTEDGGDIGIIVPGGRVFGGLPASSSSSNPTISNKSIGVVAKRTGDVSAFTRDDFLVNQSRVFAMDGGDILMWSSETNLDAGRGSKTARGLAVASYDYDNWGNIITLPPSSLAGSGIRNFAASDDVEAGSVYLFAPIGVVDAGDAGIGTAGNLFVGAVEVKGADNFDIGGVAVGVQVSTQGDAAGISGASNVGAGSTKEALEQVENIAEEKSKADEQLSWLEVFVEGIGNGNLGNEGSNSSEEDEDERI